MIIWLIIVIKTRIFAGGYIPDAGSIESLNYLENLHTPYAYN